MTVPILATVTLGAVSALPEDAVDMDFAFLAADAADATLDGIASSLDDYLSTPASGAAHRLSYYLGTQLSRAANAGSIKFYDLTGHLDGTPHGSPIRTVQITLGAGQGNDNNLPSEVACAVSYIADGWEDVGETAANPTPPPATIRPRARYRGRHFLGPINFGGASNDANMSPIPKPAMVDDIGFAAAVFMDERGGDFAVWSRADEVLRLVAPDGLWSVDNAFDTQRRRGPAATARTTIWP